MIELTEDQQRALASEQEPPRLVDPRTKAIYVLLRAELYDKIREAIAGDSDRDAPEAYPLVDRVFSEDWDDPKMAEYDHYEEHKP